MIVTDDRTALDLALDDDDLTTLLIFGEEDSRAATLHQALEDGVWEDWYRWFLITGEAELSDEEAEAWQVEDTEVEFVVLGGSVPKEVARTGLIDELLLPDSDEGDGLAIVEVFSDGDAL